MIFQFVLYAANPLGEIRFHFAYESLDLVGFGSPLAALGEQPGACARMDDGGQMRLRIGLAGGFDQDLNFIGDT